jgi:hypothetical protein
MSHHQGIYSKEKNIKNMLKKKLRQKADIG